MEAWPNSFLVWVETHPPMSVLAEARAAKAATRIVAAYMLLTDGWMDD